MPPFWHYEYIQWSGGDAPFGSFLWHSLGNGGEKVQASEFHTSSPSREVSMYDTYDIVYKDIEDHDGRPLPARGKSPRRRATRRSPTGRTSDG